MTLYNGYLAGYGSTSSASAMWVRDANNAQIWAENNGATWAYYDQPNGVVVTPALPITPWSPLPEGDYVASQLYPSDDAIYLRLVSTP